MYVCIEVRPGQMMVLFVLFFFFFPELSLLTIRNVNYDSRGCRSSGRAALRHPALRDPEMSGLCP